MAGASLDGGVAVGVVGPGASTTEAPGPSDENCSEDEHAPNSTSPARSADLPGVFSAIGGCNRDVDAGDTSEGCLYDAGRVEPHRVAAVL